MSNLKRYLPNIVFTLGALTLLASALARYAVVNGFITSPTVANEVTGQTIPYEIKGKIVFITSDERRSFQLIGTGEYVGIGLLLVYGVARELLRRRRARLEESDVGIRLVGWPSTLVKAASIDRNNRLHSLVA